MQFAKEMLRTLVCTVLILLVTFLGIAAESPDLWRSALYPENWTPDLTDEQGRFLHDFSYAGYHKGEKPLPESVPGVRVDVTKPPYNVDNSGNECATTAIQQAINDVGQAGGGTVYMPPGTYRITYPYAAMSQAIIMSYSNVVLQGAGVDQTKLYLDEINTRGKVMISVGSILDSMNWSKAKDGVIQYVREDVEARATVIPLDAPPQFAVGEWVVINYELTPEWIAEHHMSDGWDANIGGPRFYREIVAVDDVNNTITLDAPVRYAVKVRDQGQVYRVNEPLREVGLEGFSIGMKEHPGTTGWGDQDYSTYGTAAYDVHGGAAIRVRGVVNGWIRDVSTYKPEGNKFAHIQSVGIGISQSRFLTLTRVNVENPQYRGGGGNGYPYVIGGQDCLFDNLRAINGRHNFTISGMAASGNVIYRGYISNPIESLVADFHSYLSMANLIDNLTIYRDRFNAADRSGAAGSSGFPKHGVTTTASVFWNNIGLRYRSDMAAMIRSEQYGWGYVIGTRGPASAVSTGVNSRTAPVDYVEGVGKGENLDPPSLYLDQLEKRLKREGKAHLWDAVSAPLLPLPVVPDLPPVDADLRTMPVFILPTIHQQDFEATTVNELPAGWEYVINTKSPTKPYVIEAPPEISSTSGQHVLYLSREAGSSNVTSHAVFNFAPVKERFRVSFNVYTTSSTRALRLLIGGSQATPEQIHLLKSRGAVYISFGATLMVLKDSSKNTWYYGGENQVGQWYKLTVDIDIPNRVFDIYVDDVEVPSNMEPLPFWGEQADISTLAFTYQSTSNANNTDPVYIDDVVISGR